MVIWKWELGGHISSAGWATPPKKIWRKSVGMRTETQYIGKVKKGNQTTNQSSNSSGTLWPDPYPTMELSHVATPTYGIHGSQGGFELFHFVVKLLDMMPWFGGPQKLWNHHFWYFQLIGLREKTTGKPHISWRNLWFPVDFLLKESIATWGNKNHPWKPSVLGYLGYQCFHQKTFKIIPDLIRYILYWMIDMRN